MIVTFSSLLLSNRGSMSAPIYHETCKNVHQMSTTQFPFVYSHVLREERCISLFNYFVNDPINLFLLLLHLLHLFLVTSNLSFFVFLFSSFGQLFEIFKLRTISDIRRSYFKILIGSQ